MREVETVFPETADIETSSDQYAQRFDGEVGRWFLKIQEDATLNMLVPYPKASVLDVGGGHGQLTRPLVYNGYKVTVLGSAPACRQRIKDLVDDGRCTFRVGNVLELPYPDQAFDVVLSYRLLPHVTQWQRFLGELSRVARYALIVDYPEVRSINYLAPMLFQFKRRIEGNTRHFTCFREVDLLSVLKSSGFQRAERFSEFFLPMVLHRRLKSPKVSQTLERIARFCGLTEAFGSPVILKAVRPG